MSTIKTFGSVDTRSLDQLKRCMEGGRGRVAMAGRDVHDPYKD